MRHPSVQEVDMVEIDEAVVRASRKFLPEVGDWDNPKLNVLIEDGIEYVKNIEDPYDVIIIDGSDPVGPAEGLFEGDFMQACFDGLTDKGVLTAQTESPWIPDYHPSMKKVFSALDDIYPVSKMYLAYIPLYPAGMWSFSFASKGIDPLGDTVLKRVEVLQSGCPCRGFCPAELRYGYYRLAPVWLHTLKGYLFNRISPPRCGEMLENNILLTTVSGII